MALLFPSMSTSVFSTDTVTETVSLILSNVNTVVAHET